VTFAAGSGSVTDATWLPAGLIGTETSVILRSSRRQ
jgi:hypothetical protein